MIDNSAVRHEQHRGGQLGGCGPLVGPLGPLMEQPSLSPANGEPSSPIIDAEQCCTGVQQITFALLYGPVVQFSAPDGQLPSVVAMPPQLPLSVDPVYVFPPKASLPDNVAHFCFAPVLKLQEPSELSFTLTDSHGSEIYGVSVQMLCEYKPSGSKASATPRHRPVALCLLSGRPIFGSLSRLLYHMLPLVQQVHKLPTSKRTKSMTVRVGRNQYGLGLVMSTNNTILSVEAGSMAAA